MIGLLQSAQFRTMMLRVACNRAVDVAMRKLHAVDPERFHERMKTDPSNCRWCGLAAREARVELEAEA